MTMHVRIKNWAARTAIGAALLAFTVTATAGEAVPWRSGPAELTANSPGDVAALLAAASPTGEKTRLVLQFDQPVSHTERSTLRDQGVELLAYVGANAYFAAINPESIEPLAAAQMTGLVAADAVRPEWKIDPMLAGGLLPEYAVVGAIDDRTPVVATYVMFHRDVALEEGLELLATYGGTVRDVVQTLNTAVVELPADIIDGLAREEIVQWVELALPKFEPTNNSNRARVQADALQAFPYDLDGTGVRVLVYDAGNARASHIDFGGRLTVYDNDGTNTHPTHVAGTIGGSGLASGGLYRGMAPNATLLSYSFEWGSGGIFLYSNPGDMEGDYSAAINTYNADLSNNSIGTNTASNGFPCDITGNYGITSALIDEIVRGGVSHGEPFRIVWANGNERSTSRCGSTYATTAPPACAKNHLAIGALNSNNDSMTSFSSWGPADDGRMKPDFSAPGCQSNDDGGVTSPSASGDDDYASLCGTSMASPTVAGCATLLLQDYRDQFGGQGDPRNSTLKVLFAHTAEDLGNTGPDYQYGYGSVRARDAIDFMRMGSFFEGQVSDDNTYQTFITVNAGDPQLKVTLAWDDYPGTPNANPALVNDLDLRVYDPDDNQYFPWVLNPSSPASPAVQNQRNFRDNIEQVAVANPTPGIWRVEVVGYAVPEGPQPFSICATPGLIGVQLALPFGAPQTLTPGAAREFRVRVRGINETLVPGSLRLYFRYTGSTWNSVPLNYIAADLYDARLPAPTCDATPEFYVSAEGQYSGVVTQPSDAPADFFTAEVIQTTTVFEDDFNTNQGWSVENGGGLTDGAWQRGIPAGGGDRGDPANDYDGSGFCYVTDNADDNSDVDDGYTWLISPTLNLAGGDATISYAIWYTNFFGNDPNNDLFKVYLSNNNGTSWTTVQTIGPDTAPGWNTYAFNVADFLTPTSTVRVRFEASDFNDGSVVEAGVDAFYVQRFGCDLVLDDCNSNGIDDVDDILSGISQDSNDNGIPDECEDFEPGVSIVESDGQTTVTEGDSVDTYTIALASAPTANVTISLSTDTDQLTIYPQELTFSQYTWESPQTVYVLAVDDEVYEGDHTAVIEHAVSSSDQNYNGFEADDVLVHITDNDEAPLLGDLNCDGVINNFDIDPFVLALTDPAGYQAQYPDCDASRADINQDGVVNNFDIDPFVALLSEG